MASRNYVTAWDNKVFDLITPDGDVDVIYDRIKANIGTSYNFALKITRKLTADSTPIIYYGLITMSEL